MNKTWLVLQVWYPKWLSERNKSYKYKVVLKNMDVTLVLLLYVELANFRVG